MRREYSSVRVDKVTLAKLGFICKMLDKKKTGFLRDLIDRLFDVSSEFKEGYIEYMPYGNVLRIEFSGKSVLITGAMPMPTEISDEACDIAVNTVVEAEIEQRKEREK